MSQFSDSPIENAEEIIDRFGGIRPMASKMDVPVTTVQGWKKRGVIPAGRRAEIVSAAVDNNVDLSGLLSEAPPVNENTRSQEAEPVEMPRDLSAPARAQSRSSEWHDHEDIMKAIKTSQHKAVTTSIWTATALIGVAVAAGVFLLWPQAKEDIDSSLTQQEAKLAEIDQNVNGLDQEVKDLNMRSAFLKKIVPEDMQERLDNLQNQAANLQNTMSQLSERAAVVKDNVLSGDAGALSDRIAALEEQFAGISGGEAMSGLAAKIQQLEQSMGGQEQLAGAMSELQGIVDNLDTRVSSLDQELESAKNGEGDLSQTLDGVSSQDLKAAAMLIAFSQLRDSLNRETPFEEDLALLRKMVGPDNPELTEALDRLAPQADNGVLSSAGLSNEFRGLAGDIVVASLKGEDVSIMDRAKARLSELFNVKKDGELVGGTQTQALVTQAQQQLDSGDIQGAIATLQSLDGDAAQQAQPFIEEAQASVMASQVQSMLQQMILSKVGGALGASGTMPEMPSMPPMGAPGASSSSVMQDPATALEGIMPQREVIIDEESGIKILPQDDGLPGQFKGLSGQ